MDNEILENRSNLSNANYNRLKKITMIGLPVAGSTYFCFSVIWSLPSAEYVVGAIVLVIAFFGVALEISSDRYVSTVDGDVIITENVKDGKKKVTMQLEKTPEEFERMDLVRFKVLNRKV